MSDKKYLEITDENNNIIKYEILLAFKIENDDNYYVVYTDNISNEETFYAYITIEGTGSIKSGNFIRNIDLQWILQI